MSNTNQPTELEMMLNKNTEQPVDMKSFYLVLSLYDASLNQTNIPAEVSNLYKDYLEKGKGDWEGANKNLLTPITPAYYALKQLIEGEGYNVMNSFPMRGVTSKLYYKKTIQERVFEAYTKRDCIHCS